MKALLLFIFPFVSTIAFSQSNDRGLEDLKGPVKTMTEYIYKADWNGKYIKGDKIAFPGHMSYEFDSAGNLLYSYLLDNKDKKQSTTRYEKKDGRRYKSSTPNSSTGIWFWTGKFSCEIKYYDSGDSLISITKQKLNKSYQFDNWESFDKNNRLVASNKYYRNANMEIEKVDVYYKGESGTKTYTILERDDHGNWIKAGTETFRGSLHFYRFLERVITYY